MTSKLQLQPWKTMQREHLDPWLQAREYWEQVGNPVCKDVPRLWRPALNAGVAISTSRKSSNERRAAPLPLWCCTAKLPALQINTCFAELRRSARMGTDVKCVYIPLLESVWLKSHARWNGPWLSSYQVQETFKPPRAKRACCSSFSQGVQ